MRPFIRTTAALLCFGSAAAAYILGANAVFQRFGEAQAEPRALAGQLVGTAAIGPPAGDAAQAVPVRLSLSFPGTCRLELERQASPESVEYRRGRVTSHGGVDPAMVAFARLACPALAMRGLSPHAGQVAIAALAARLGVDTATVSLARYRRRAAFVVGAKPRDLSRPQIWFDQRWRLPVRIVATAAGQLWDVRFVDPLSLATGRVAPRRIQVFQAHQQTLELELMTPTGAPAATDDSDARRSAGD